MLIPLPTPQHNFKLHVGNCVERASKSLEWKMNSCKDNDRIQDGHIPSGNVMNMTHTSRRPCTAIKSSIHSLYFLSAIAAIIANSVVIRPSSAYLHTSGPSFVPRQFIHCNRHGSNAIVRTQRQCPNSWALSASSTSSGGSATTAEGVITTPPLQQNMRNKRRNQNQNHTTNKRNDNNKHTSQKHRIKTMFKQAKEMERTGQWRQACTHLEKILELDPYDSYSYLALGRLQSRRERGGKIHSQGKDENGHYNNNTTDDHNNNNNNNSNNTTPLKILQSEPLSEARKVFYDGTEKCPTSVHLWQAWALHEQNQGNIHNARYLFQKALQIDKTNPYVCHGYGLLEHRCGNFDQAMELWKRPLTQNGKTSAALVCSLGKLLVAKGKLHEARDLYLTEVVKIKSERQVCEVYLAAAWLEEKHFLNVNKAEELLQMALTISPDNSRALIALARLAGRKVDLDDDVNHSESNAKVDIVRRKHFVVKKQLEATCTKLIGKKQIRAHKGKSKKGDVVDGRLFNAWADMEVKEKHYGKARNILIEGRKLFPKDQALLQAAGKVEERVGNFTGARDLYGESLSLAPSAPALIAYALLELNQPAENSSNYTKVQRLFEEALLLDPRHGPVYNAFGNMELKRGNIERARQIYQNGVFANCRDVASVYHGLAMLELSMGNVETARLVLIKGLKEVKINDGMMDNSRRKRSQFLTHTLGMLELNSNRAAEAKIIFESGLERHVNSSQLLLGAALAEVKLGNEDAARALFERSVNVDQKHAHAWQSWGVMEMRAGNYKVAKTLFQCGLKNDQEHGALWQAYATMESRLGNFENARALFAAGVTKCPNHVPLYQAWACLELRGENFDKAKSLISEALTRDKSEGSGWLVAAKIEEKLGNEGLMIMILRRGLECAPNSAELYCAVASYEVKRGKIDLARELLEKGLEVDPLHAPLYHSLAELEARVFNIQGLAALNKRASKIFTNNALESPPLSVNLLGSKLRKSSQSKKKIPNNINILAKKMNDFEVDVEDTMTAMDPDSIIDNFDMVRLENDDLVKDIFLENVDNIDTT